MVYTVAMLMVKDLRTLYALAEEHYGEEISRGSKRAVFRKDDHTVVKVPLNYAGIVDNEHEMAVDAPYLAKTSWVELGPFTVLGMEFVDTDLAVEDMPPWAGSIDCYQVGRALDGRIVAYDYGIT